MEGTNAVAIQFVIPGLIFLVISMAGVCGFFLSKFVNRIESSTDRLVEGLDKAVASLNQLTFQQVASEKVLVEHRDELLRLEREIELGRERYHDIVNDFQAIHQTLELIRLTLDREGMKVPPPLTVSSQRNKATPA